MENNKLCMFLKEILENILTGEAINLTIDGSQSKKMEKRETLGVSTVPSPAYLCLINPFVLQIKWYYTRKKKKKEINI